MDSRSNECQDKSLPQTESSSKDCKSSELYNSSPQAEDPKAVFQLTSNESDSITPEEGYWVDFENCLKDIDKNYDRPEYISKIRGSASHIESLKELVRVYSEVVGIKEDYDIQTRQDEIIYLFKTGKNEYEFFKLFDNLLETCGSYFATRKNIKRPEKKSDSESQNKTIREIKEEFRIKSLDQDKNGSIEKERFKDKAINDLISIKVGLAMKKVDEKLALFTVRSNEMDKQVNKINKSLKKIQNSIDKRLNGFVRPVPQFEQKNLMTIPMKRRRFSTVESVINFKGKGREIRSPTDSSDSGSEDSFGSTCHDQSVILEKDHDLDDMIFKLRLRGGVKMTDIWRLNNFAVIFNISELKSILDVGKVDELSKLKPWASRWKAKDKYFSNMKKVASPSYSRNITKYENSLAGITACLSEYYLFHFDLYCTWRKLKLWLKDISSTIDLCITPSYPHRIRSVIAQESETGFALLLEKAIPYLTKQRLERTPNLILYSFIDDYPDDYLMKSQYCIVGRHQHTDLKKLLSSGHT